MSKLKNLKPSVTLFLLFCAAWTRKLMFRCWWWFPETGLLCPLGLKEDHMWWFQPEAHHHLQLEALMTLAPLDSHHPSSAVTPALPAERDSCLFHQRFSDYRNSTQALSCERLHVENILSAEMQKHWWGESVSPSLELLFFLPDLNVSAASLHWAAVEFPEKHFCGYRL